MGANGATEDVLSRKSSKTRALRNASKRSSESRQGDPGHSLDDPRASKMRSSLKASKTRSSSKSTEIPLDEEFVLDDVEHKGRVGNNAAGSWSGAGAGAEAAAKGNPDGQICGVNVVILPSAWYMLYWDLIMMALIMVIVFLLPYEAAFVPSYSSLTFGEMTRTQFAFMVVNRILDAFFSVDFLLQFVLGYVDSEGKVVTKLSKIRNKYLKSYFTIDFMSLFPFDQVIQSESTPLLRAIKFLRLLKLLRALRANRIISRLMSHIDISAATKKISKDFLILAVIMHFVVCSWAYFANNGGSDDPDRWIYLNEIDMSSTTAMYITIVQLTFTSLGDIQVILIPDQMLKIVTATVLSLISAFIIAELTDLIQTASAGDTAYQRSLEQMNGLMREKKFPSDLRFRLRDFLRFKHEKEGDMASSPERLEMMKSLSPQLQVQVTDQLQTVGLKTNPLFVNAKEDVMIKINLALNSQLVGATEVIFKEGDPAEYLCILEKGFVISAGRVIQGGSIFGHECLLAGSFDEILHGHSTHSLTFCSMTRIHVHQLEQIVNKSAPLFWRTLRKRAMKALIARGLTRYCQLALRRQEKGDRGARRLAAEMINMGVGKIVIFKMSLAYRYVSGENEEIERAARRLQKWYRTARARKAFKMLLFRERMTRLYFPKEVAPSGGLSTAQGGSEISRLISNFAPPASSNEHDETAYKMDLMAQQVGALFQEQRKMTRTIDTIAMLIRKQALGL